ncbi:MAG TPA: anthrone oxygenase family protein [Gammaproteobacteria bacterium]|nr:anthrone oxygenase family protein [Gammaproteobacteria bacterium]
MNAIELPIAITGIGSLLFLAAAALLERRNATVPYLLLAAGALVLVANVVTVTVNVPINRRIARIRAGRAAGRLAFVARPLVARAPDTQGGS